MNYTKLFATALLSVALVGCAEDPSSSSVGSITRDGQSLETAYNFTEAAKIMDTLGNQVVSSEMYYVTGVVTKSAYNSQYGSYNLTCTFDTDKTFLFYSVRIESSGDWTAENVVAGKTVVGYGYLEKFYEKYEMPYLSAKYSPTGVAVTPSVWIVNA